MEDALLQRYLLPEETKKQICFTFETKEQILTIYFTKHVFEPQIWRFSIQKKVGFHLQLQFLFSHKYILYSESDCSRQEYFILIL